MRNFDWECRNFDWENHSSAELTGAVIQPINDDDSSIDSTHSQAALLYANCFWITDSTGNDITFMLIVPIYGSLYYQFNWHRSNCGTIYHLQLISQQNFHAKKLNDESEMTQENSDAIKVE
ncbi:hypothetical protein LOAG_03560 [Loa loa]|uniref:Uncharacterized protein n=1 Tax=Loa loa TaxID=7209 RepID=A0A1S0U5Y3_LOALO|nr:hypothetical protein LOAG_03560 [Loa loa]EFO24925.1 hypothetical protein LOAG_03560 [Loa loa]